MLDRMLISGHVGLLAVPHSLGATLYKPDGSRMADVPLHQINRLFGRAGDLIERPVGDVADGLVELNRERSKAIVVRLMLMVLDAEEDDELAGRAATRLNVLLRDTSLGVYLKDQFYSAPLPPGVDTARAERFGGRNIRFGLLCNVLIAKQSIITAVRAAFDTATEMLARAEADLVLEAAIDGGTFRRLVEEPDQQAQALADFTAMVPGVKDDALRERWLQGMRAATKTLAEPAAARPTRFGSSPPAAPSHAAPVVTMQALLETGAHFGHQTHRWNAKMKPYIFGDRNGIHILDLSQTVPLFARALEFVAAATGAGGKLLFVGTKRQAQEPIADAARRSGQHFVNQRWLGGMLTNWKTIANSIKRMKALEEQLSGNIHSLTKREILNLTRERDKLELSLGGIRDMGGIPDVMFVIDANKEELAIKEANTLGIPVVAILDSNVSPDGIAFPVPANDDAIRAIRLYCEAIAIAAGADAPDRAWRHIKDGLRDGGPSEIMSVNEVPVAEPGPEASAAEVRAAEPERSASFSRWHRVSE